MEILVDALPSVVAFLLISILTFIGWGIRKMYKFSHDMQKLLEKEMTNGKPAGQGESTKDIMSGIRDVLKAHDAWAREDAEQRNAALAEQRKILRSRRHF